MDLGQFYCDIKGRDKAPNVDIFQFSILVLQSLQQVKVCSSSTILAKFFVTKFQYEIKDNALCKSKVNKNYSNIRKVFISKYICQIKLKKIIHARTSSFGDNLKTILS